MLSSCLYIRYMNDDGIEKMEGNKYMNQANRISDWKLDHKTHFVTLCGRVSRYGPVQSVTSRKKMELITVKIALVVGQYLSQAGLSSK
jgi:hypothetical protein